MAEDERTDRLTTAIERIADQHDEQQRLDPTAQRRAEGQFLLDRLCQQTGIGQTDEDEENPDAA